ncbi:C1 family peptidase [Paenibacillus sp. MBLB4367]|uniref:C1 family peptidase n=1 Tax=Paenibacillus sp. MBLB4367 TaxID=3384767 RepID=UPI0039081DCE
MRKYAVRKDGWDMRDLYYQSAAGVSSRLLPKRIDLRPYCSEVVDQEELGSCTANAIVSGLREYMEMRSLAESGDFRRLSRLFLYWHERRLEGTINQDAGATIRSGMKVLHTIGVCPEDDYPYDISRFREQPSVKAEEEAAAYRIDGYRRIIGLAGLKAALAEGKPAVVGFLVYESFESERTARTGKLKMPDVLREQVLGGHAVLAVGYRDGLMGSGAVIIRNSWGPDWGDKGYCYFPYKMFERDIVFDIWTY